MDNALQLKMAHVPVITPKVACPIPDFPLAVNEVYQFFVYGKHSHCTNYMLLLSFAMCIIPTKKNREYSSHTVTSFLLILFEKCSFCVSHSFAF